MPCITAACFVADPTNEALPVRRTASSQSRRQGRQGSSLLASGTGRVGPLDSSQSFQGDRSLGDKPLHYSVWKISGQKPTYE